ncbi:histidinol-phosphate transaminase [Geitlerinema sp. PCC 9228]|jgi:histidinol-phosphate aminotransferase|uniref:histidinol-phosphate transaminase n=1 Tax=Geitlerinema sp. PCC 9228 TaxID=111611 RepID=UPI0008F9CE6F|nr:histidinol-phosphate transaminase [Geitlerinema sp. PCC 9228]
MFSFLRSDLADLVSYTPQPEDFLGKQNTKQEQIDRLDTNENPYDLPQDLKAKLAQTYQDIIAVNRYPDGSHGKLKQAIAEYTNESAGVRHFHPANISVGNGSDELIRSLLIATCIGNNGSILVANPTFSMYEILAKTLGISVKTVERNPSTFEIDLDAASKMVADADPPVKVVFVVHPNSPTANKLTEREIAWLQELPERVLVVIDEAYFEFCQHTLAPEITRHPNWVVLRTFSKAFRLAGHRVGYAISHPMLTATLEKIRLPYNLPSFSQAAARAVLSHREELLQVVSEIQKQRQKLIAAFQKLPGVQVWPSNANFIYLRFQGNAAANERKMQEIADGMKARGTLIRHTGGGLRITVGSEEENKHTVQRFQEILKS